MSPGIIRILIRTDRIGQEVGAAVPCQDLAPFATLVPDPEAPERVPVTGWLVWTPQDAPLRPWSEAALFLDAGPPPEDAIVVEARVIAESIALPARGGL